MAHRRSPRKLPETGDTTQAGQMRNHVDVAHAWQAIRSKQGKATDEALFEAWIRSRQYPTDCSATVGLLHRYLGFDRGGGKCTGG